MTLHTASLKLRLAESEADLIAALRLRYRVFVEELGGTGPLVDHAARLERDHFDPFADHLVLVDDARPAGDHVVGVYRLMTEAGSLAAGQFYTDNEFDLAPLRATGRRLLELGRSCVDVEHRTGAAMFHLWTGLAHFVKAHDIEILFGVASFHGTDLDKLAQPLSLLHHRHLAPPALRVAARPPGARAMNLIPERALDRRSAMVAVPQLIKAYLRLGGVVGDGAWVDDAFNTTDVCLIMDTARMNAKAAGVYTQGAPS